MKYIEDIMEQIKRKIVGTDFDSVVYLLSFLSLKVSKRPQTRIVRFARIGF